MWVLKFSKYLVTQFFPPWVSEGNDLHFFLKKRIKLTFTKKYAKDLYTDVSKIIQFFYFRFALPKVWLDMNKDVILRIWMVLFCCFLFNWNNYKV